MKVPSDIFLGIFVFIKKRVVTPQTDKLFKVAMALAVFTILYNIAEGFVSIYFGISDDSLTLSGFGVDSLIEVVSGIGIMQMIIRIRISGNENRGSFENSALRITGSAFYLLMAILIITAIYNLYIGHKPENTLWGVIISCISISVMMILLAMKLRIGRKLSSEAMIADAHCTRVCIYMSVVLLASSALYKVFGLGWIDILGILGLAWFSFTEGRECFEKANSNSHCTCKKT
jgi:divalent metal cation (Fe/Co/Zn/Cd) transporter